MAAQGKALTYLLTVLGGIAGALLGFIVTGLVAYGLLGLAGMGDREGGLAMIAFISISPFGALAGLLAGICLVLRYRGGYRGFAGVAGRGALIVAGIFALGALVPLIYGLTDDVLVRNGLPRKRSSRSGCRQMPCFPRSLRASRSTSRPIRTPCRPLSPRRGLRTGGL